jgi:DNA-binding response OmpR family regulator
MAAGVWKILIVEDDEDDYFLTRELLAQARGQRYRFTWARTAAATRALLHSGGFDVVVMDERLPDGSGTALIR